MAVAVRSQQRTTQQSSRLRVPEAAQPLQAANWRHRAECRQLDPELFFPVGTNHAANLQTRAAKAVCGHCAVRAECLEWAMSSGQESGVWGGRSESERKALKRQSARRRRANV
jgi:WhiB family transcriptional regulator, redox-sensing transcriptional regulator